ncbi:MAG: hypothetical protein WC655_12800, partial [Candidatus Hydrogenedentales bacterium]
SAAVFFKGNLVALNGKGPEWQVDIKPDVLENPQSMQEEDPNMFAYGYRGAARENVQSLRPRLTRTVLADPDFPGLLNTAMPPMFCGWSNQADLSGVIPAADMKRTSRQALILADIEVVYDGIVE